MSSSEPPLAPTLELINDRVNNIREFLNPPVDDLFFYLIHRDRESSAKMTKVEHVALEFLAWRDARDRNAPEFKTQGFRDRYTPASRPAGKEAEKLAAKVRPWAVSLRDELLAYYLHNFGIPPRTQAHLDPPQSEVSAGRAERIVYIEIPKGEGWKPFIIWRTRAIKKATSSSDDWINFESVGTNFVAMKYLVEHIPLASRVEDTAIRWDSNTLPYPDDLNGFRAALKESKATYKLITGPVKHKAYMEVLREVYLEKPGGSKMLECFRLDQALPMMNFTILYYPETLKRSSEVLYGYGIKQGRNSVDKTTVFRTNNPDLVKEYMRLFEALRDHPSSYPISPHSPDFIDSQENERDVIATYKNFGDISLENLIKKEERAQIKVCFTCTHEMGRLVKIFKEHLPQIESIQVLLPTLDSKFLKLREEALPADPLPPYSLKNLIETNITDLKELAPLVNTAVHQTRRLMPVMFFQVGRIIIFSPFWNGRPVATGPQSVVRANSKTGTALEEQFDNLWKHHETVTVDLSKTLKPSE